MKTKSSLTVIFLLGCFLINGLHAQPVNKLHGDVAMPSPEAASLGKYIDVPVGYYTGTPGISIPIHVVKDGSLSLPISLSYHASGVKVGELASWVGLGWSLNAGGRVMRTVMGLPDEALGGYFSNGNTVQSIPPMDPFNPPAGPIIELDQIHNSQLDGEADMFSFNFAGYSGKFYYNASGNPVLVPRQNMKIERHLSGGMLKGFTFTTPDGTKYHFGVKSVSSNQPEYETTQTFSGDNWTNAYPTSWMPVEIESFDGNDRIAFQYTTERFSYNSLGSCTSVQLGSGIPCSREVYYRVETKRLASINYPFGSVQFNANEFRNDLEKYFHFDGNNNFDNTAGRRLDEIAITEGGGVLCKKIQFFFNYWQDNSSYATGGAADKRLKLQSIQEKSCDESIIIPSYIFSYLGGSTNYLPHRLSMAIDHWGFYNGADSNNDTGPNMLNIPEISTTISTTNGLLEINYPGVSDRETHEPPMLLGTLDKVTYPTGGEHRFEFEANDYFRVRTEQAPPLLVADHVYLGGFCGTLTTVAQPTSISFAANELPGLRYTIANQGIDCSNGLTPSFSIKVFVTGTTTNPVASVSFPVGGETEYMNSGYLQELLNNALQSGVNYRFETHGVNVRGKFMVLTDEPVIIEENVKVGGLRVKKVEVDDASGNTIVRTYKYEQLGNSTRSSGVLYNLPRYWFNFDNIPLIVNSNGDVGLGCYNCTIFMENAIVPLGDFQGNHIGYERVIDDHEGNGLKEFIFYSEQPPYPVDNYTYAKYPFAPEQLREIAGNQYSTTIVDESDEIVQSNISTNFPADYTNDPGKMVKTAGANPSGGGILWQTYHVRTRIPFRTQQTIQTIDGVIETTTFEYGGINDPSHPHYNPTAMTLINSDGKPHRTEIGYAREEGNQFMINANMVGIPIREKKIVGGELAGGYFKEYVSGYPMKYYEILKDNSQLLRGEITAYNADGLPEDYISMGFAPIDYQWNAEKLLTQRSFIDWDWMYEYFNNNNSPFLKKITDIDDQETDYSYDKLGRLKTVTSRDGNITTTFTYQIGGPNSITTQTVYADAPTQSIVQEFDGLGRPVKTAHNGVTKKELFYDQFGRLFKETYLPGNYTTYDFDDSPLNRVVQTTYPDFSFITTEYGSDGNYYKTTVRDNTATGTSLKTSSATTQWTDSASPSRG